jgi:DNA-binding transcriptional ArsR family regulator
MSRDRRFLLKGVSRTVHMVARPCPRGGCVSLALRQLLWYLIAGTRGGWNRGQIIDALRQRPQNAHELSQTLRLDYRTVRHHLALLEQHGLVARPAGAVYGSPYFLASILEANLPLYDEIRDAAVLGGQIRVRFGHRGKAS